MKIGVTGAAGLIGSWIVEECLSQGHTIVSIDNMIGGYRDSIIQHENHKFFECDITKVENIDFIASLISGCDIIYHCAALAHEGFSVFAPSSITNSVFTGTVVMATAAIKSNVKRFINCSSMSRYGDSISPFTEKTPPKPVDPYAHSKVAAEEQLNMLGRMHNMEVIHTVPHNVIGPRQRYTDPYRNVVSIMTNLMLQGRQPIIYGNGKQTRCFSMIQDDVGIYMKLMNHDIREHGELFNIGPDDREISIIDLARIIAKEINFDLKPNFQLARPYEVERAICSSDKIRKVFGFEPSMTLEDGIKSIITYVRARGPQPFDYHIKMEIDNKENSPKTWKEKLF